MLVLSRTWKLVVPAVALALPLVVTAAGPAAPPYLSVAASTVVSIEVDLAELPGPPMLQQASAAILPVYPPAARRGRLDGRVVLSGVVDADGKVTGLQCVECKPDRAGFVASAMEAIGNWLYEPVQAPDGSPVAVSISFDIRYTP